MAQMMTSQGLDPSQLGGLAFTAVGPDGTPIQVNVRIPAGLGGMGGGVGGQGGHVGQSLSAARSMEAYSALVAELQERWWVLLRVQ